MIAQTLTLILSLAATGQGNSIRTSVDSVGNYNDSVWLSTVSNVTYVNYQRNGLSSPTLTFQGGAPDVDVDENGNTVIAYVAPTTSYITIIYNSVSNKYTIPYAGEAPAVTISRTSGIISVTWRGAASNRAGHIYAATFSAGTPITLTSGINPTTGQLTTFVSDPSSTSATYSEPDISSNYNGDYTITWVEATSTGGVLISGYHAGTNTTYYSRGVAAPTSSGVGLYTRSVISGYNGGPVVLAWNQSSNGSTSTPFNVFCKYIGSSNLTANPSFGNDAIQGQPLGSAIYAGAGIGTSGYYIDNLAISCLRTSSTADYIVSWSASVYPYGSGATTSAVGGSNVVYQKVSGGTLAAGPTFVTTRNDSMQGQGVLGFVASALSSAGYIIDWTDNNGANQGELISSP